jgi:hypothetical protein
VAAEAKEEEFSNKEDVMGESMVDKRLFEAAIRYVLVSRWLGRVLRSLI